MPSRGEIGVIKEVLRSDEELSIEWQITDFLSLSSAGVDFYVSPDIPFCGEDWFLSVWPSGMTWASDSWVDLFLFRKCTGPRRTLDVSLAIRDANGKKQRTNEFSSRDDGCGWTNFSLRSTLSGLLRDGALVIACDVKRCGYDLDPPSNANDVLSSEEAADQLEALSGRSRSSKEQDEASNQEAPVQTEAISGESQPTENQGSPHNRHGNVIRSMKALFEEGRRSDFKLKLGDREWRLHKMFLESRSPHFADLFQGEWAESAEGEFLTDDVFTEDSLDSVLHFIYTGEVEDIYVEDLCDLYIAADRCRMDELKPLCVESMKENMCVAIVCRALYIAKTYGEDELNKVAVEYFVREAAKILGTDEWDRLSREHPEVLVGLLEDSARSGGGIA